MDAGASVGANTTLGNWVKIGENAVIGAQCDLPDHVRVQPGVIVPDGTKLQGHELVTKDGIIPNRVGGFAHDSPPYGRDPVRLMGSFGRFVIPAHLFSEDLIEDYFWGRSETLASYQVFPEPETA